MYAIRSYYVQGFPAISNRFGIAPGKIMDDCETGVENCVLRVLRAQTDGFFQMFVRLLNLVV